MGRVRGKGKKLNATNHEDTGSGEEEKIPSQKRRGRPQKPKDEIDEEEFEKLDEEDKENGNTGIASKDTKSHAEEDNAKKRKRQSPAKEESDAIKEENSVGTRSNADDAAKSNGFRHNGSRRKSKPRRAAEAGVKCN